MGFYEDMQGVATDLLTEFAQGQVTITRVTPGTPDPDAPWVPVEPTTETVTLAAAVKRVEQRFVNGTTVVGTEDQAMFAVPGFEPDMACEFTVDGRRRILKDLIRIPAAGTPVAYIAIVAA